MKRTRIRRKHIPSGGKDTLVAYLLMFPPLGFWGIHKFYMNQPMWALAYIFTGAFGGLGILYDLLTIPRQVQDCNRQIGWNGGGGLHVEISTGASSPSTDDVIDADYEYVKSEAQQRKASGRYEKPSAEEMTLEARVLEIAERAEMNQVTLKDLIREGMPLKEAKEVLERMAREGVCEEVSMDGTKVYCF